MPWSTRNRGIFDCILALGWSQEKNQKARKRIAMFGPKMSVKFKNPKTNKPIELVLGPPVDEAEVIKSFVLWFNDNRVRQYLSMNMGLTESSEREWIVGQGHNKEALVWMMYADGVLVGSLGLHRINLTDRQAELGISVGNKEYWGKGIATAAEIAVIDYAFSNIVAEGLHKVWARVFSGNGASQKVIEEKVGFRAIGTRKEDVWCNGAWYDVWMGEMLKSDWQTRREESIKSAGIEKLDLYPGIQK